MGESEEREIGNQKEQMWTNCDNGGGRLNSVSKPGDRNEAVNEVAGQHGWVKVRNQVDGAIDTVAPKAVAEHVTLKETRASKQGVGHVAAEARRPGTMWRRSSKGGQSRERERVWQCKSQT